MPIGTKYVFIVSMDVAPEKEDLFNEVYDREHIPNLLEIPGVLSGDPGQERAVRAEHRRRAQGDGRRQPPLHRDLRAREP